MIGVLQIPFPEKQGKAGGRMSRSTRQQIEATAVAVENIKGIPIEWRNL